MSIGVRNLFISESYFFNSKMSCKDQLLNFKKQVFSELLYAPPFFCMNEYIWMIFYVFRGAV